jgi:hypothetical protein
LLLLLLLLPPLLGTAYCGCAAGEARWEDCLVAAPVPVVVTSVASAAFRHSTRLGAESRRLHASIKMGATLALAMPAGATTKKAAIGIQALFIVVMFALKSDQDDSADSR